MGSSIDASPTWPPAADALAAAGVLACDTSKNDKPPPAPSLSIDTEGNSEESAAEGDNAAAGDGVRVRARPPDAA